MEITDQQTRRNQVISIDYEKEALRQRWKKAHRDAERVRFQLPYSYAQFIDLISAYANIIMQERRELGLFVVDKFNEPFLKLLWNYTILNRDIEKPEFLSSIGVKTADFYLNKGIMLQGSIGCGKSLIMQSYSHMVTDYAGKYHLPTNLFIKSTDLYEDLKSEMKFLRIPVTVDEFGRENKEVKIYGEEKQPVIKWISKRYDLGALTHGTTNFKFETLESDEYYGKMIGNRLKSMMNFITLDGPSRRR